MALSQFPQPHIQGGTGGHFSVLIQPGAGVIVTTAKQAPQKPLWDPALPTPDPNRKQAPFPFVPSRDAANIETAAWAPAADPLSRFSDFVFLAHKQACVNDVNCMKRLSFFVEDYVADETTLAIMNQAVWPGGGSQASFNRWPGKQFTISNEAEADAAKALIGTPNGASLGFMLLQHWAQYRGDLILSSTVFAADVPDDGMYHIGAPCLAWELNNVPSW